MCEKSGREKGTMNERKINKMRLGKNNFPMLANKTFSFETHDTMMGKINTSLVRSDCLDIVKSFGVSYVSELFLEESSKNYSKLKDYRATVSGIHFAHAFKGGALVIGVLDVIIFAFSNGVLVGAMINKGNELDLPGSVWGMVGGFFDKDSYDLSPTYFHEIQAAIVLFEKHAETKAKTLPSGNRVKEFNCKYTSDILYPVKLLTENWYMQSCRTHPFIVRGHWRMQAHGEQRKERKLIWIDAFTKHGYTKGAYKDQ